MLKVFEYNLVDLLEKLSTLMKQHLQVLCYICLEVDHILLFKFCCTNSSYHLLGREVSKLPFRIIHSQVTKYHFDYHMVSLSKLQEMRSKVSLFKYRQVLALQLWKHLSLLTYILLPKLQIYLHILSLYAIFSFREVFLSLKSYELMLSIFRFQEFMYGFLYIH